MPKDAGPTRATILTAAVHTLQREGLDGFTLDAVARRGGVVKGLVVYHYGSRNRLLRAAAARLVTQRDTALQAVLTPGATVKALDACWEELRRQAEDGTTRAWLAVCAAGLVDRSSDGGGFEAAARTALLDGCAVALAAGAPLADVRDAYDALWLSLLEAL